jgi:hypothetical protein
MLCAVATAAVFLGLFFALGATFTSAQGIPSVGANGKVISNRVTVAPGNHYPNGMPPESPPGPIVLEIPGFGIVFVSSCPDFVATSVSQAMFRNTSGEVIDAPGVISIFPDNVLQPGAEVFLPGGEPGFSASFQLGSGSGRDPKVATVTVSGIFDAEQNVCRFNAQAMVAGN